MPLEAEDAEAVADVDAIESNAGANDENEQSEPTQTLKGTRCQGLSLSHTRCAEFDAG